MVRTFSKERQVDFDDCSIETKNGLKVGLDYIASQVCDYNHLGVWLIIVAGACLVNVHLDHRRHSRFKLYSCDM